MKSKKSLVLLFIDLIKLLFIAINTFLVFNIQVLLHILHSFAENNSLILHKIQCNDVTINAFLIFPK